MVKLLILQLALCFRSDHRHDLLIQQLQGRQRPRQVGQLLGQEALGPACAAAEAHRQSLVTDLQSRPGPGGVRQIPGPELTQLRLRSLAEGIQERRVAKAGQSPGRVHQLLHRVALKGRPKLCEASEERLVLEGDESKGPQQVGHVLWVELLQDLHGFHADRLQQWAVLLGEVRQRSGHVGKRLREELGHLGTGQRADGSEERFVPSQLSTSLFILFIFIASFFSMFYIFEYVSCLLCSRRPALSSSPAWPRPMPCSPDSAP